MLALRNLLESSSVQIFSVGHQVSVCQYSRTVIPNLFPIWETIKKKKILGEPLHLPHHYCKGDNSHIPRNPIWKT